MGLAGSARADGWTKADTVLEVSGAALHVMDWSQTLDIARAQVRPPGANFTRPRFAEANPILGDRPSASAISTYFAGTLLAHAAIAYVLPHPYRTVWQMLWLGVEGGSVANNLHAGVGFQLP